MFKYWNFAIFAQFFKRLSKFRDFYLNVPEYISFKDLGFLADIKKYIPQDLVPFTLKI